MNAISQDQGRASLPVEQPETAAQRMSAWMDDEADVAELDAVLEALRDDRTLGLAWASYHVIGESLRQELPARLGASPSAFLAQVRERLAAEAGDRPAAALVPVAVGATQPIVRGRAANDALFRWKMVAGVASLAAVMAVAWGVLGSMPSGAGTAAQLAAVPAAVAPAGSVVAVGGTGPQTAAPPVTVVVETPQGAMVRDARLMRLLAEHRQYGMSALQMPAGFLRNATHDGAPSR